MKTPQLIVNPKEYGLEEAKANELLSGIELLRKEKESLSKWFDEISKLEINEENEGKFRECRLAHQKYRTKIIEPFRKAKKEWFLRGGQFIDATIKSEFLLECETKEDKLMTGERFSANLKQKRLKELREKRWKEIEKYTDIEPRGIEGMDEDVFEAMKSGLIFKHEQKIEAELKAEKERQIQAEKEEKIKKNKEALLPYSLFIDDFYNIDFEIVKVEEVLQKAKKLKADAEAKAEAQRKENEKLKAEAEALELKRQAELKAEKEKQAKLEAELKAKRDAEAKAEADRLAKELEAKAEAERLAKAPIKEQLNRWVDSFSIEGAPVMNETSEEIQAKFTAFKNWAKNQIIKL